MTAAMDDLMDRWARAKLSRRIWTLREPRRARGTHKRALGAHGEFAEVVIQGAPAETFSFTSKVTWPAGDNYDDWVLHAALDVLLCSGPERLTGIALTLEEIGWHDVDSSAVAFYWAARLAVQEIAGFDVHGYPRHFSVQQP